MLEALLGASQNLNPKVNYPNLVPEEHRRIIVKLLINNCGTLRANAEVLSVEDLAELLNIDPYTLHYLYTLENDRIRGGDIVSLSASTSSTPRKTLSPTVVPTSS